jgi:SAM-dependent methyltransferase
MSSEQMREFYDRGYSASAVPSLEQLQRITSSRSNRIGATLELLTTGRSLLDIGCGPGTLLWGAQSRYRRLVGLDIAPSQIEIARQVLEGLDVDLRTCDVEENGIPYDDAEFDVVGCLVVLEFVFSPEKILAEICRVLSPNGRAVISIGNIVSVRNRLRAAAGRAPHTTQFAGAINGGALHWFGATEFASLADRSGLRVERLFCSGRWSALRRVRPQLLGDDLIFVLVHKDVSHYPSDGGHA